MSFRFHTALALSALGLVWACHRDGPMQIAEPAPPDAAAKTRPESTVAPRPQIAIIALPLLVRDTCIGTKTPGPRAQVLYGGEPAANVTVTFSVIEGGGALSSDTATTGVDGIATAGEWLLGGSPGTNRALASLANGASAAFVVSTADNRRVAAVFQLQTIGGRPLPQTYSGGGSSWTITGGHYYLADNGTYAFGYEFDPTSPPSSICSRATFIRDTSGIQFYLAPGSYPASEFYAQRGGLFSVATLTPYGMAVKYEDFVDFDDETYTLSGGSLPALAHVLARP